LTRTVNVKHIKRMKLDAYMTLAGITDQKLADSIGRDRTTILRLRSGKTVAPDWETVIAIQDATGGAVRAEDWAEAVRAKSEKQDAA